MGDDKLEQAHKVFGAECDKFGKQLTALTARNAELVEWRNVAEGKLIECGITIGRLIEDNATEIRRNAELRAALEGLERMAGTACMEDDPARVAARAALKEPCN